MEGQANMKHYYPTQGMAEQERRKLVERGYDAGLVLFSPSRNLYYFSVFGA